MADVASIGSYGVKRYIKKFNSERTQKVDNTSEKRDETIAYNATDNGDKENQTKAIEKESLKEEYNFSKCREEVKSIVTSLTNWETYLASRSLTL